MNPNLKIVKSNHIKKENERNIKTTNVSPVPVQRRGNTMEERKAKLRVQLTRTWHKEPEGRQLREELSDVQIEVAGAPAASIPAHSAVLANSSKYFRALFTNGMAQSTSKRQKTKRLRSKGPSDNGENVSPTIVKITGYPLPIVQYFVEHLYNTQYEGGQEGITFVEDWEQLLQLADEYECLTLFDNVSIHILAEFLDPNIAEVVTTLELLKIGMHRPCHSSSPSYTKRSNRRAAERRAGRFEKVSSDEWQL
ncbi:BTB/POZ domain protein [Ostertagia ostertagi]